MISEADIVRIVLEAYPDTEGVYRFGSSGTEYERPDSDLDLAVLLPPVLAHETGDLAHSALHAALEAAFGRDVDLINLRAASTVFKIQVISADRLIYCGNRYSVDEFEMLTLSFYQKLNEERAEILAEGLRSGRFCADGRGAAQ